MYISGKITGDNYAEVVEKFADAEAQISDLQYFPINPIKNGLPPIATWDEHMVKDIELLLTCDAIYMLTDWKNPGSPHRTFHSSRERDGALVSTQFYEL